MAISDGTHLGPYQIHSLLGAGGMGEVYKATDTRLNRIVAIKTLPEHLSGTQDLRQRFEREARAVSSLNHPNICTLYDIGSHNGTDYIVMEYLEGETLAERLLKGPLPKPDLFRFGIQIADALYKAHGHGIVHRDLKPANIFLTRNGVKLLDFGLAKLQPTASTAFGVSALPTKEREITEEGTVLGTVQYMAPEQLEGKEADQRTDIFALGMVLYEMAAGRKAFQGNSKASLIAAILKEEPPSLLEIQPLTPPLLERLIRGCLEKHPEDRWQSVHDISQQLRWIQEGSGTQHVTALPKSHPSEKRSGARSIAVAALVLLIAGIAGTLLLAPRLFQKSPKRIETHFSMPSAEFLRQRLNQADPDFSISPDGARIVYPLMDAVDRKTRLYVRDFSQDRARVIPGTEGASLAFWSPDGKQIAFISDSRMKRISLAGGTAESICDVQEEFRGGVWLPDGTILFSTVNSEILRVSAEGGEPQPVTKLDKTRNERSHNWPTPLPGYKKFLFLSSTPDMAQRTLYLGSLDDTNVTPLFKSFFTGKYIAPGYLAFVRGDTLFVQRFEEDPPRLMEEPVRISDGIVVNMLRGATPVDTSWDGVIAYRTFGDMYKTQLTWFDRTGTRLATAGPVTTDVSVTLSQDDKRAFVSSLSETARSTGRGELPVNIWMVDLARSLRTRITFEPSNSDENPTLSPDGRSFVFASHLMGANAELYQKMSSGEGQTVPILQGPGNEHPIDWSPDGKYLLLHTDSGNAGSLDILMLALDGDRKPLPFVATRFVEGQAQFSPDGRWVAYTSGESGRLEVYVKPFPSGEDKWQISSNGGAEPRWRADGKELFYVSLDGVLTSVPVSAVGQDFQISTPVVLFETHLPLVDLNHYGGAARYDVTADGKRFLVNTVVVPQQPPTLNIITNWNPPAR